MKAKTILNTYGALITLGGAAVGSYYALNSKPSTKPFLNSGKEQENSKSRPRKSISEWLKNKGNKTILSAHDATKESVWKTKWENFKKWYDEKNPDDEWGIFDWNTKKNNGEGYRKFQELCKSNSEKETDDEGAKLIAEVIKHCVEDSK